MPSPLGRMTESSSPTPPALVAPGLRALMHEIVDYAGLFPPARLPLDEAIRAYAAYRRSPEAWMLGRFVCPVKRLPDLAAHADLFAANPPFRFSVLGSGGPDAPAFLAAFEADLAALTAFHDRHPGQVRAEVMEVRLPATLRTAEADALRGFFGDVHTALARSGLPGLDLFCEVPLDDALPGTLPPLLTAMAAYNRTRPAAPEAEVGLKMRCGGVEASMFPPPERIALAMAACLRAGVRFKATAGLHHPIRHFNDSVQTKMNGFFNVFGAAVLATAHALDEAAILDILHDENADHFRFPDGTFVWKTHAANPEAIRQVRATAALSFGSCSFDEPRDDLRALGLL